MEDSALLSRMFANMAACWAAIAASSPGGTTIQQRGVTACIVPLLPRAPYLSLFNSLIFEIDALNSETLAELESAFLESGVEVWIAWTHESDVGANDLLARSGYVPAATNRAMARELGGTQFACAGSSSRGRGERLVAARINEQAWGVADGSFVQALESFEHQDSSVYLAEVEDAKAACVTAFNHEGDCGIYFVATYEWARRRGLALDLVVTALAEAKAAGCTTSSLQASADGEPLYRKLGYRDLGGLDLWERRPSEGLTRSALTAGSLR